MAAPLGPDEFRYRQESALHAALPRFAVAGLLLLASLISGFWGVVALVHASWLDTNDLPVGDEVFWGVVMLCLATVQGLTAFLLVFDRLLGFVLGIALAVLTMLAQLAVIGAYPVWSLIGIAVNVTVILVLIGARTRD
ncbi:MAG TPA: hypothetical protein VD836_09690 [Solirubrobacteraceae bacterium]|nr:hypothetical protein [Solirubrobacteraceae bacterium]